MTFGVDPAPSKKTVIWSSQGPEAVAPAQMPERFAQIAAAGPVLVAWDAPLSFAPGNYSDRAVDRVVRKWIKAQVAENHLAKRAVSVLPFAGCPHWAITCATLGLPFVPEPGSRAWKLVESPKAINAPSVIEVHPAVALALMWVERGVPTPMPRYKGDPDACASIVTALDLPAEAGKDDDVLDAFIAYQLAVAFREDRARWLGGPAEGGYVVMRSSLADELAHGLATRPKRKVPAR